MKAIAAIAAVLMLSVTLEKAVYAQAENACGPDDVKFQVHTAKQDKPTTIASAPDKATVYIISWEDRGNVAYIGCGAVTRFGLDGKWMGANCGYSYSVLQVDPGEHHLCTDWQARAFYQQAISATSFAAEAGKTYYFRVAVVNDPHRKPSMDVNQIDSDKANTLLSTSKVSTSTVKK
jgi:hypothetical protein